MLSLGMLFSIALSTASRRRGFMPGSAPPMRAATVISLMRRVKILPRLASWRPLRCWMFAHLLWPAMGLRREFSFEGANGNIPAPSSPEPERVLPPLVVAKSDVELGLLPGMANRHGLIAGATGTGKTVTLQSVAEALSSIGVPVFMADVKGDLAGLAAPGGGNPKVAERVKMLGIAGHAPLASPVAFWDVFGEQGHPVRATVTEMGPLLLGR